MKHSHHTSEHTEFWQKEYFPGALLFASAVLAMILMNSPLREGLLELRAIKFGAFGLSLSIDYWIKDGLMAIFFLFVTLELKRELLVGVLANPRHAALPVAASIGGTVVPALVYMVFNHDSGFTQGWAVPSATDIAFSLGVLSLLGDRVPNLLKAFLLALAIVDDIAAVLIIAVGYTAEIVPGYLGAVAGLFAAMMLGNRLGIKRLEFYWVLGALMWLAMLHSGVHATIAGVLTACAVPLAKGRNTAPVDEQPLMVAEHALRPGVQLFIMPLYALIAAGFTLSGMTIEGVLHPVTLGIFFGLVIGKPLGIMLFAWGFNRLSGGQVAIPWYKILGASCLAGIGFTMSLFIGHLAFGYAEEEEYVKMGVFFGSLLSAGLGYAVLDRVLPRKGHAHATSPAAPFLTKGSASPLDK